MNFFIFIIMKAICIQSTFNKCTILATTDLQQINTSRLDQKKNLLEIFTNKKKKEFINAVNKIIASDKNREEIITKKLNYILNNYSSIKAMLESTIWSSMESHISHLIASFFSSRPKGFSTKRIDQYLKLNDYKHNGINILNYICNLIIMRMLLK